MPRPSARQVALRKLKIVLQVREAAATLRYLYDDEDLSEDELDILRAAAYERLNMTEVLKHFRLEREAFFRLVDLVRDHPVMDSSGTFPFRGGVELHMLVLLKCLGVFGNDNTWSKHAHFLGIGKGTIGDYLQRALGALLTLDASTAAWTDELERS
ncbi:putative DDE Tnp4 domain-containing protein [Phytophthora infestans]|uniref:Putative DDE Tnp4 domain-containing protein n=1 Tax=Phytophthora infestans TaxID=4787 RepID=A0A8S9UPH7_PHYIN|nr:putative DDE Tnp4 domain-containing protein [Phytophthora infestans]